MKTPSASLALLLLSFCACTQDGTEANPADSGMGSTDASDAGSLDSHAPDGAVDGATDTGHAVEGGLDASDAAARSDAAADAFMPELPIVNNTYGGPILANPRIVPVVYSSDPLLVTIGDFVSKLAGSSYFVEATKEYGVGAPTVTSPVVISDPPPAVIQGTDIATWIAANATAAADGGAPEVGPAWPAPDGNTVYIVFYPESTTIQNTSQSGGTSVSCTDFGGYHDETPSAPGTSGVPFGVIARCKDYLGLGGTDFVTFAASHEAIEAATDPYVRSFPAFFDVNYAGSGWSTAAGGPEVGDLCKLEASSQIRPADVGYLVQRIWSNAAARHAHDPCAPAPPAATYFLAVPDMTGTEIYPGYYTQGVAVPVGGSVTVDVHLYADTPDAGTWTIAASEPTLPQMPDPYRQLALSLDHATGSSGDVLHLTIKRHLPMGVPAFGAPFVITSTQGQVTHSYWGVVGD